MKSETREKLATLRVALAIDRHDLDTMASRQPQLYHEVAEQLVQAKAKRDTSMDALKVVCSELSLEIRKELEQAGEKVTEGRVDAEMRQRKVHREAKDVHMRAERDVQHWEILKEAFVQRSMMLKQLADLWVGGYYQSPGVRGSDADYKAAREKIKQAKTKGK